MLLLWTYDVKRQPAVWPFHFEPEYAEVVVRGLSRMIPGLAAYAGNFGRPYVDGGYYCKTRENRPLIGPLPVAGALRLRGAVGLWHHGFAGGGGCWRRISSEELPEYAEAMALSRYEDAGYRKLLEGWDATMGQL